MESPKFEALAFKLLAKETEQELEDMINKTEDEHSYSENDFGLNDGIIGPIRNNSGLKLMVLRILKTYKIINPLFEFQEENNPKRNLTTPCEGVLNNQKDNVDNNLIIYVQDEIKSPNHSYIVEDIIGQGISGQVFKVKYNNKDYALKIIKNRRAYLNQALIELKILEMLNKDIDKNDQYHIIRIFDYFYYFEHLCIVFELLSDNLYQLLLKNHLQGISLSSIRFITKQILEAVEQVHKAKIMHCDLKPENILLKLDKDNPKGEISIKVIDFGSACLKGHTIFKYIQSRYYRAPEVIIGLPYSTEIDIWSIGCIAAELFLGGPLLPGSCEYDQLCKMEELLGEIPDYLLFDSKNLKKFYKIDPKTHKPILKNIDEYYKEFPNELKPKYKIPFDLKCIDDLINIKRDVIKKKEHHNHSGFSFNSSIYNDDLCAFIHFLKGLLYIDPKLRWNAKQCLRHPFITKEKLDKFISFCPDEVSQFLYLSGESTQLMGNDGGNRYSYNPYHSLIMNNNQRQFNMSSNSNNSYCQNTSNNNISYDNMVYQPNLQNIQMNWVKNFPYAMVDQCNLYPGNQPQNFNQKNSANNNNKLNNTFMTTSFEKIDTGNTYNCFRQRQKQNQNDNDKNKNKQKKSNNQLNYLQKMKQHQHQKYLMVNSFQHQPASLNLNPPSSIQLNYYSPNMNKRDFPQEYLGLQNQQTTLGQYFNSNNKDGVKRTRSQSDYNNPIRKDSKEQMILKKQTLEQEIKEEDNNQNEDDLQLDYHS